MSKVQRNSFASVWILTIGVILATCVFLMVGCGQSKPQPKDFDVEGEATITLNENFYHEHHSSFNGEFGYKGVMFFDGKTEVIFNKFLRTDSNDMTVAQFGRSHSDGALKTSAFVCSLDAKLCYITEYELKGKNYYTYNTRYFFKTTNAYYTVDFCTNKPKDFKNYEDIDNWVKSIKFTDELIYDVDF